MQRTCPGPARNFFPWTALVDRRLACRIRDRGCSSLTCSVHIRLDDYEALLSWQPSHAALSGKHSLRDIERIGFAARIREGQPGQR